MCDVVHAGLDVAVGRTVPPRRVGVASLNRLRQRGMIACMQTKHARALVNPDQPHHALLDEALECVQTAIDPKARALKGVSWPVDAEWDTSRDHIGSGFAVEYVADE